MIATVTGGDATATQSWDFFVSYTGADAAWAEWISWQLEGAGYRVLVQSWDFVPGSNWAELMQAGLTRATRVIAVLSPTYLESSQFGAAEWQAAWTGDPRGVLRRVIPVRVADCGRPGMLAGIVSVDLFDIDEGAAARRLLGAISDAVSGRAKPSQAPGYPGPDRSVRGSSSVPDCAIPSSVPDCAIPPVFPAVAPAAEGRVWRVFLSHTGELSRFPSGRSFTAAAVEAVVRAGHAPVEMGTWSAADRPPAANDVRRLTGCDVYVAILGFRYGSLVPDDPMSRSFTEHEFDSATELGIPRLVFLLSDAPRVPLPRELLHEPDRRLGDRQDAFRAKVDAAGGTRAIVASPEELELLLFQALTELSIESAQTDAQADVVTTARRSVYLQQVARIAPPVVNGAPGLLGRDVELAELAAFCTAPDPELGGGSYVWWRARAWAGKSALMATFVLHPPEQVRDRVRIVSYFITARLAAQDTRAAFTAALLDQLAALTGQGAPATLPSELREAFMLDLLAQAARTCNAEGRRLILIVDGLDEDRGVTSGPDSHSIAALLPIDPPSGMRVIVAGRPDPRIPDDVLAGHPLHDPGIFRALDPSPYAQDMERLGRRELSRLLHGTSLEQDLLGLLTAARGGLSARDLADLTDTPRWKIDAVLGSVAGRTFARRASLWNQGAVAEVYLLGHEELQAVASTSLGGPAVDRYRERLHAWADNYQARSWPPGTPEYLLRGYYQLLAETNDLDRLIRLATDPARHNRLLDMTGGDAAALAEIANAQTLVCSQDYPDLLSALRLAWHRDWLADRNRNIPTVLPVVWAVLGHSIRAEALARAIPGEETRVYVLADVAKAMAKTGHHRDAEDLARTIKEPKRSYLLADLARTAARSGDPQRAEALARSIKEPGQQAYVLADLVQVIAKAGDHLGAIALARSITEPVDRSRALMNLARASANSNDHDRADVLASEAEVSARTITDPTNQMSVFTDLACLAFETGSRQRGAALVDEAEATAGATAGAYTLAFLARVAGKGEDRHKVEGLIAQSRAVARTSADFDQRAYALKDLARITAETGDRQLAGDILGEAAKILPLIGNLDIQERVTFSVMMAAADIGDYQWAEDLAWPLSKRFGRGLEINQLASRIAECGDHQRAVALARKIVDPYNRFGALADVARVTIKNGDRRLAEELALEARTIAHAITKLDSQRYALSRLVELAADAGDYQRGQAIARSIPEPETRARGFIDLVRTAVTRGDLQQAQALAVEAETAARTVTEPKTRAQTLADLASVAAEGGDSQRAEALAHEAETTARKIIDPKAQTDALKELARAAAMSGDHERARTLALAITERDVQSRTLTDVAQVAMSSEAASTSPPQAPIREHSHASTSTSTFTQQSAGSDLVGTDARGDDQERGQDVAGTMLDPGKPPGRLAGLAHGTAQCRMAQGASACAMEVEIVEQTVTSPKVRAQVLHILARLAQKSGDQRYAEAMTAEAKKVPHAIADPFEAAPALTALVRAFAKFWNRQQISNLASEAARIARTIWEPDYRSDVQANLAQAVAESGDFQQAKAVASSITHSWMRDHARADVARVAAKIGDYELADLIARDISDRKQRRQLLVAMVQTTAEGGDHRRAETIANAITDPEIQAQALVDLASAIVESQTASVGEPVSTRSLVARALSVWRWTVSCNVLGRVDAAAVQAFLDEYWDRIVTHQVSAGAPS